LSGKVVNALKGVSKAVPLVPRALPVGIYCPFFRLTEVNSL
jgi:hypothetical protein